MKNETSLTLTMPLGTLGIITGTVLSILQGIGTIDIGWFWATFPFWIVPALGILVILVLFIVMTIAFRLQD